MPTSTQPNGSPGDKPGKSKFEQEIEEILARAERENPLPPPTPIRPRRNTNAGKYVRKFADVNASGRLRQWLDSAPILVALMAGFVALLLRDLSPLLATFAAIAAVVALFWPVIVSFRAPRTGPKMWRGREVDTEPEQPEAVTRFQDWLRKKGILK